MNKNVDYNGLVAVLRSMKEEELFYFFMHAGEKENFELCEACLDAGADIDICENLYKEPLLIKLLNNGKLTRKTADWFLEKGANINKTDSAGHSCLTICCMEGNFDMAKYFLGKGIKITQQPDVKLFYSDLYHAVDVGSYELVKLLLEHGASNEIDVVDTENPVIRAIEKGRDNIVELFVQYGVPASFANNYKAGRKKVVCV